MPLPIPSNALRAALAFGPEVVHAQSPFVSGLMARRMARRLAVPLVFTHHTRFADYGHYLGPLARPASAATAGYLRRFWSGCAAVIAPSANLAAEIERRLDPRRHRPLLRVVPTGLDIAIIRGLPRIDPRRLAGWPADTVVVASLGRLAPEKSVAQLVEAFADAAVAEPRLRLLLIGGGPSEVALQARAAALGGVHLTGQLPRLDALSLLKGSDLFAFASRTETQGLVLSEALACGLPVVALDGPAIDESLRDGVDGILAPTEPSLGAALLDLARSPERRARMAAAARQGAERFDSRRRIGEMEAVYREVLGSAPTS